MSGHETPDQHPGGGDQPEPGYHQVVIAELSMLLSPDQHLGGGDQPEPGYHQVDIAELTMLLSTRK